MKSGTLPRIGAAMPIYALASHREWILSEQRDVEIQDPTMKDVLDADWKPILKQVRETLDGYKGRMGVHGPFIGFNLAAGFDKVLCAAVVSRFTKSLQFAGELGADHMVIHSPFISFGASAFSITPEPRETTFAHVVLDRILEMAERNKCCLVIENIQDMNTIPLRELVSSFNSEWVRMSLDTGHAFITHKLGGPCPDQWVRDGAKLLTHVHINDTDGQKDRHWAPGDGDVNWYALFESLSALPSMPKLILEMGDHRNIEKGARFLASQGYVI